MLRLASFIIAAVLAATVGQLSLAITSPQQTLFTQNGWANSFKPKYYVCTNGSDSNSGLSSTTPWKTVAKINASTFAPGAVVGFCGGQTWAEGLSAPSSGSPSASIVFTSYGLGRATLAPTGTTDALDVLDKEYLTIDNINLAPASGGAGFYISASSASRHNFILQNFSATGGIGNFIAGDSGTSGWTNFTIQNFVISGVTGSNSGILAYGSGGSGVKVHSGVLIQNGVLANNGSSGLALGNTNGALIQGVVAHDNGALATVGPVGLWAYESSNVTFQYNESYNNKTASSDGGGFDIDGGCTNVVMQYNYSHGNAGAGFLLWNYASVTWANNTVRFNISENDGADTSNFYGAVSIALTSGSSQLTGIAVYNNTFYSNRATPRSIINIGSQAATSTGHIANNIFYTASTNLLVTSTSTSLLTFTGNDYFSSGTFAISWNGTSYSTFAAWQTATSQEKISGVNVGLNVDPALVAPGSGGTVGGYAPPAPTAYQLATGSPMIGAGLDLNAQFSIAPGPQDYYGNPNPRSAVYPVGAYGGAGVAAVSSDLNFAAGTSSGCASFASCLTETNSSGGTCTDNTGLVHVIAANTLRVCSGTGLLVEQSSQNLELQSQNFTALGWAATNATATANTTIAPDGTTTGSTITTASTSSGGGTAQQNVSATAGLVYTISVFLKPGNVNFSFIQVNAYNSGGPSSPIDAAVQNFNVSTGAVGTQSNLLGTLTMTVGTPVLYANGYYRVSLTFTLPATAVGFGAYIGGADANTSRSATAGDTIVGWGAQAENAAYASSYMPSTTFAFTRGSDNIAASGALATTLAGSTGTIVVNTNSSLQSAAATLVDANGTVLLGKTSGNLGTTAVGATLSTGNTGTWTGANDLGLAWDGTGGAIQLNAGTIVTDATARTPSATFHFGSTSGSSAFFNGYFTRSTAYTTKQASPQ